MVKAGFSTQETDKAWDSSISSINATFSDTMVDVFSTNKFSKLNCRRHIGGMK